MGLGDAAFDGLPDPCLVVRDGRVAYANPELVRLLGREALGLALGEVFRGPPESFDAPDPVRLELRVTRGEGVFLDVRGATRDDGSEVLVARDVTELMLRLDAMGRLSRLHGSRASAALVSLDALITESRPVFMALGWSVTVFEVLPTGDACRVRANVMVQGGPAEDPEGPFAHVLSGATLPLEQMSGVAAVVRSGAPVWLHDIPSMVRRETLAETGEVDLAERREQALTQTDVLRGVCVPVWVDDVVTHVLSVVGPSVVALDLPAIELLATMISTSEQVTAIGRALAREERRTALGQMAAQLAHEVRNPLAVLFQAARQLRRRLGTETDAAGLMAMVDEETHRLRKLVDDLVRFAAPGRPRVIAVHLAELARWSAESLVNDTPSVSEGVQIAIEVAEDVLVEADPGMLRHVLLNLLLHGCVHAGPGGKVVVSAAPDARDPEAVRLRVRSSGPSYDAETERRVFEPFYSARGGGSGLGLAVVQRLVEEQNGRVALDHDVESGVSISAWLLRATQRAETLPVRGSAG
ncbi:MAG: PAS domain-containing sensor histidine kinase [Myxococcota bacterium]